MIGSVVPMIAENENHLTVRQALPVDAPALAALYRELVGDSRINVTPSQVGRMAESDVSFLLVAVGDGEVCGTVLLTLCPDAMYGEQPFGVIENLVVMGARRASGVGGMLMEHIEQIAMERRCTKLMLLSSAHRREAHAFFRHQGYSFDKKVGFVRYASAFGSAPAARAEAGDGGDGPGA
ncbi:MAG: GNAT family N-acetyltransferase [Verrucomicrobiaceae bacterium]|nr:MAG: GNAT family N-acetyltransferase [Verrucomicrobiaceae bacterium]